ncbi:MAG: maleylpyruvate isomerase N-terminal domain-containing protein [Chitinophagaceae bacterium]|nr:maleylpyruvate isomerase N-terminal domain-containing protein [Chitinophagaceae bacterium]
MQPVPVPTAHLFPVLDQHLIDLLRSLQPADWNRATLARQWTVKDIAAHLLDGNIRAISIYRDKHFGEAPPVINGYGDLVTFLNELNGVWVKALKRMSPALLTDLLAHTGAAYAEEMQRLDPWENALFSVAWAGEEVSFNWFHIAREYTEKFHHQLQIRESVGQTDVLMSPELFYPFINTLMRGLPHAYRNTEASTGTIVQVNITGHEGGSWHLIRNGQQWILQEGGADDATATVSIPPAVAWKLFTKGLTAREAEQLTSISGDAALGKAALSMIAVIA